MTLNLDIVGKKTDPEPYTYDSDRIIQYALSIGASVENELDFVYEKYLKVFPTFAVIPATPRIRTFFRQININMFAVLHGEQTIVLHRKFPPDGTLYLSAGVDAIYDKGDKGAHIILRYEAKNEAGEPVYDSFSLLVDRSAGNFGGAPGPKKSPSHPPEGKDPDFRVAYETSPDQCALYRLNGDKVLFHIDPDAARKSGLERPIFMGLGTMGFAGRAVLHSVCKSDPARLKYFSVRMVGVVYPGDTLITSGWKVKNGTYVITTENRDGKVVLANGIAVVE